MSMDGSFRHLYSFCPPAPGNIHNIITTEHRTENILYGLRTILPMFKQTLFIFQNMILNIQNMYLVDILYIQRNVLN